MSLQGTLATWQFHLKAPPPCGGETEREITTACYARFVSDGNV
jgi:hypothetical protein